MDAQARSKLIVELTADRDEQNHKAAELERRAALARPGHERTRLESEASELRQSAREVNRRLAELDDSEIHDDDRGGIER
ncbi:MAG: hypothetical protein JSR36_15560 [Proteobacteria bacterium]|nr:hypothetical protein [Pseudomonadota bacterium]